MSGGGNAGVLHQLFGPGFAGFQLRPVSTWAEDSDASLPQRVGQTCCQGGFRSNDHQIDRFSAAVLHQTISIGFSDRNLLITGSAVSRCNPDRFHGGAAPQSPAEGMLPAAAADD